MKKNSSVGEMDGEYITVNDNVMIKVGDKVCFKLYNKQMKVGEYTSLAFTPSEKIIIITTDIGTYGQHPKEVYSVHTSTVERYKRQL